MVPLEANPQHVKLVAMLLMCVGIAPLTPAAVHAEAEAEDRSV